MRHRFVGLLAAALVVIALPCRAEEGADPPAPRPPTNDPVVNVFLQAPADLEALWRTLRKPDFVILRGEEYERLRNATARPVATPVPGPAVVRSVQLRGTVLERLCNLIVDFGVTLPNPGPTWVGLELGGQPLGSAREDDVDLPVRAANRGWEVELSGAGRHVVRVSLIVPVGPTTDGHAMELDIPEAASTRVAIEVPQRVTEAWAGPSEPIALTPVGGKVQTMLEADLAPRKRLALSWRVADESAAALPPLLDARGELAVDVDAGLLRIRSSWSLRSVRGLTRSLQIQLDPADELLEVELDGQPPPAGIERAERVNRLTIPLATPLGPGRERRLTLTTRRTLGPAGKALRVGFQGMPLLAAGQQAGVVAVAQAGNTFVSGVAARGLRRIDPRTALPDDLRARPGVVLAYQFSEQPFDLTLRIEPSPPLLRVEPRSTVFLEASLARVVSVFEFTVNRGRPEDLTFRVPPGLAIDAVGPDDVVTAWQCVDDDRPGRLEGGQRLTARVAPRGPEPSRFSVRVTGRHVLSGGGDVTIPLPEPEGVIHDEATVAVLVGPGLEVVPPPPGTGSSQEPPGYRLDTRPPPANWPWPTGKAPTAESVTWLRKAGAGSSGGPSLRLESRPLAVSHATTLHVRVGRTGVVVEQETDLTFQHGLADSFEAEVPASLEGRWEVGGGSSGAPASPGGTRRIELGGAPARSGRSRLRYRIPLGKELTPGSSVDLDLPWIRVASARPSTRLRATLETEPGVTATLRGATWNADESDGDARVASARVDEAGEVVQIVAREDDVSNLPLRVSRRNLASLPDVFVPRLLLRSARASDGTVITSLQMNVETRRAAIVVALPPGAELHRVRVADETLDQVDQLDPGEIRIPLPSRFNGGTNGVPLELVYQTTSGSASAWAPPRILEGGVVQQSYWEARIPWSQALVGVPGDWTDENQWYWAGYVWKRRPWLDDAGARAWALGAGSQADATGRSPDSMGDAQRYLFGRPGPPRDLPVWIVSRASLVALCSGLVLGVGGLVLLVHRPARSLAWAFGLLGALCVGLALRPSATILALQAGEIGAVLTVLLAVIQGLVERRRQPPGGATEELTSPAASTPSPSASTFNRVLGVGSDDSTAIRVRAPQHTTMDYVPTAGMPAASRSDDGGDDTRPRAERVARGGTPPS